MYCIEVLVTEPGPLGCYHKVWRQMHPTDRPPYRFKTRDEAERTAEKCYPMETTSTIRVRKV